MFASIVYLAQRAVFPALLTLCIITRPTFLSIPYLICLFYAPFLPMATDKTARKRLKCFLKCVVVISALIVIIQIGLQLVLYVKNINSLLAMGSLGSNLSKSGIVELYKLDTDTFCWAFLFDAALCGMSVVTIVVLRHFPVTEQNTDTEEPAILDNFLGQSKYLKSKCHVVIRSIVIFGVIATVALAATLQPSIPGLAYFTTLIFLITTWALNKPMYHSFVISCRILCIVLIIHITSIFVCQTSLVEKHVSRNSTRLRYFGLKSLIKQVENNFVPVIVWKQVDSLVNPIVLLLCYYITVIFLRDIYKKEKANGSKSTSDQPVQDEDNFSRVSKMQKSLVGRIFGFVCRHSNIVSNLMMMVWSIVFRSWLSITFLLVVSILWTRPIERKSAHRINLFIVFYADVLLLLQYIYCMMMTMDDHTFENKRIVSLLSQIGIVRYEMFPFIPLIFKVICTLTFCFTLRQEQINEAGKRKFTDSSFGGKETIWKYFKLGVNVLTHLWVSMILITMFVYVIFGSHVNLFKFIYMIYILVFIISFQISLPAWRKITYGLWMLVIISSMINLILIYTYQFEEFDTLWEKYLGFDKHIQNIIGLRRFATKELLFHLLYFTFLVVITSIQLLIFHKNYTKQYVWNENVANEPSKVEENINSNDEERPAFQRINSIIDVNRKIFDWICSLLEMQFFKVVLILGFVMSINEVSIFNFLLVILVIVACFHEDTAPKMSCGIISLIAGIIIVLKMFYQLIQTSEGHLSTICSRNKHGSASGGMSIAAMMICDISNIAQWIGIKTPANGQAVFQYLGVYLVYLAAATVFTTVSHYQARKRLQRGESPDRPQVLYPNVTREHADRCVNLLIKYLFNYGFYKFGVEITLVSMVMLISFRMDAISIVYIIWLCILIGAHRRTKRFIWPILQYFVMVLIILQFIVILNLPSFLHAKFPRQFDLIQNLEHLIALKNHPSKLLLDFILLISVCRQRVVFDIEKKYGGRKFDGGRNESSVKDVDIIISGQLPIRTHDFLYPTNWLDILKCVVYYSSYWFTLFVVLITGTNNVNIFSLGYLVSSFLFCYIGTNFYMKPIRTILQWWNSLIAFNIFVIISKSLLNMRFILKGVFLSPDMVGYSFLYMEHAKILEMGYDCLCFTFLIFQLRIFKSFDFCHIINESKATFVCDSRGTKLLADRMHEMHTTQVQREKDTLENIKEKLERIKANQQKFEPNLTSATSHQEAVRYKGKYLYEELVEHEFHPRQLESIEESEESFLLRKSRIDSYTKNSTMTIRDESSIANESTSHTNIEQPRPDSFLLSVSRDLLISFTLYLYKFSRNYRFVHEILTKEKKLLKLKSCGEPEGVTEEREYFFSHQHSILSEFFQSLWFALIANTDVICYLFIFLNTIVSMSLFTLPISLAVCLWATLTIPRPSKRFWLTIIAYIEFLVFVQYFLQIISHFHKIPINSSHATYNLILLHFVLFHRSVLKHMGIWTFTKKINQDAVHAWDFLNTRSLKATIRWNSMVQIPADVYTFMFLCDLINFFVLMFGFSAFSQSPYDDEVQNYLKEDQIPFRFLLTLVVQFVCLIIDRALYLRRNMKGKIIFHLISVVALHIWQIHFMMLFHEKPGHTTTWPPMIFYFIKCVYFLFSAYQIRCGYPKRVSGNFANNGFSLMHWRVFEFYQMIPFLSEARTLLDWICIKTSLTLYEWFKMEDIFSDMFVIKCHREYEKSVPRPRGVVRGSKGDYMRAIVSLIVFFVLIWGPWALFTFDHTVGKSNTPYEVDVSLQVGTIGPIYRIIAQTRDIHQFTESDFDKMKEIYANDTAVQSFLTKYDEEDIAAVSLDTNSTMVWMISPPSLQKFKDELIRNVTLKIRYSISISRLTHEQPTDTVGSDQFYYLHENDTIREEFLRILLDGDRNQLLHIPSIFPKFLKVTNSKGLQPVPQFLLQKSSYRNITLGLHEYNGMQWWEVVEECKDSFHEEILSKLPYADCEENNILYTFNDKLFPSSLSPYIGGGIIGLYSTYILLTSKFFRQFLASKVSDIIREDLPYVDRILQLCSDIYLVREQGDFQLEEDLYAKLIFLYRSPETLIRWTRTPETVNSVHDISEIDESDAEKALRKSLNHRII